MRDASAFYSAQDGPEAHAPASATAVSHQLASMSISRQHAVAASRSDPFGHSVSGRGHWSVGPIPTTIR